MVDFGSPYSAIPCGPIGPGSVGGYPYPAPGIYGAPYAAAGGAWYALLIILFIVILVFGSFWYIGSRFY
ncbi:hypothetical protein [Niallia sp. 03133]|uniref:hypothetical protein n=1 Tax=Niallia sp. 03133 TaxID=3458060 RepID=UPI004044B124